MRKASLNFILPELRTLLTINTVHLKNGGTVTVNPGIVAGRQARDPGSYNNNALFHRVCFRLNLIPNL